MTAVNIYSCIVAASALILGATAQASSRGCTSTLTSTIVQHTLSFINHRRTTHGNNQNKAPLVLSVELSDVATRKLESANIDGVSNIYCWKDPIEECPDNNGSGDVAEKVLERIHDIDDGLNVAVVRAISDLSNPLSGGLGNLFNPNGELYDEVKFILTDTSHEFRNVGIAVRGNYLALLASDAEDQPYTACALGYSSSGSSQYLPMAAALSCLAATI